MTTVKEIQPQIEYYVYGSVAPSNRCSLRQARPSPRYLGVQHRSIPVSVYPAFGNIGIDGAGLRNWVLNLNAALADKSVYLAYILISTLSH